MFVCSYSLLPEEVRAELPTLEDKLPKAPVAPPQKKASAAPKLPPQREKPAAVATATGPSKAKAPTKPTGKTQVCVFVGVASVKARGALNELQVASGER